MPNYNLDDLLRAIAVAVRDANQELVEGARQDVERHFTEKDGALVPNTMPLVLPRDHVGEGEDPQGVHDVPHAALVHHRPIGIDNLKVEFDCRIEGLQPACKDQPPRVRILLGPEVASDSSVGRISIEFRASDPPEGVARVNDKLLKSF
jgi:hypothetical protein